MTAEVKTAFIDKHTGVLYKAGEVITITKKRFAEINSANPNLVEEKKTSNSEEE